MKLLLVAGARPNFMKVAPLIHAIHRHDATGSTGASPGGSECPPSALRPLPSDLCPLSYRLVHTGQHYDAAMSGVFFQELGIPAPDFNLDVGSGSHASQTAEIMKRFEPVLLNAFAGSPLRLDRGDATLSNRIGEGLGVRSGEVSSSNFPAAITTCSQLSTLNSQPTPLPDWVIVFGDVNSTVACTLVAVKLGIRVAHVEAGLRSFDRTMPEEINRIVTDSIADLLLTPSEDANENLRREGVPESRIALVGNIMIDSLIANLDKARQSDALDRFSVQPGAFVYVTLHRPANVDDRASLTAIATELKNLSHTLPVVFPVHPRTRKMFAEFGIGLEQHNGLRLVDPVGYHDSVCLTKNARLVLTDSGGLQEEATFFQTPCLTLRPNTERPVTITLGSNRLTNVAALPQDLGDVLSGASRLGKIPALWDGKTAARIVERLIGPDL